MENLAALIVESGRKRCKKSTPKRRDRKTTTLVNIQKYSPAMLVMPLAVHMHSYKLLQTKEFKKLVTNRSEFEMLHRLKPGRKKLCH